jgi:Fe-S cluster assembly protein SufD
MMTTTLESQLLEQAVRLDGQKPSSLSALRAIGREEFKKQGLPTGRLEEWRVTPIDALRDIAFQSPSPDTPDATTGARADSGLWWNRALADIPTLTTLNGLATSIPEIASVGVDIYDDLPNAANSDSVVPGSVATLDESPFAALNTAFTQQVLHITAEHAERTELHIAHTVSPTDTTPHLHPRVVIHVKANASLRLIESTRSLQEGPYLINTVTEIVLDEGAQLEHIRIQDDATDAYSFGSIYVRQAANANYESFALNMGSAIGRNDFYVRMEGEGGASKLNGLYTGRDNQLLDTHSIIEHCVPHCTSSELYKGVLDDKARGVFRGLIHVHPHASQTLAYQTSRALLLSDTAKAHTKPQLLIFNDDVKCSHGATIGALDEDALFFLQSRGMTPAKARGVLTTAFSDEVFADLDFPVLKHAITDHLRESYAE